MLDVQLKEPETRLRQRFYTLPSVMMLPCQYLGAQGTNSLLGNCTYQPVIARIALLKEPISG